MADEQSSSKKIEKVEESDFSIDLTKMLEAGMHFGHLARRWHPKMSKFIWQNRDGVHIFDLLKTSKCIQVACNEAKRMTAEGKTIVFVGTKRQASAIVKAEAERAGSPYIVSRWPGGLMTNWEQVQKSLERFKYLRDGFKEEKFNQYTKKERVVMEKEMTRLQRFFGGVVDLKKPADALFIVDVLREKSAIREARALGVKVFAIVDSNVDPEVVDYPIPANDDAVRSIKLIVEKFADAISEGKQVLASANRN